MTRTLKRLIIIFIYLFIFIILGWLLYYAIKPAPSCSDGKKNQSEVGVDCGGSCAPCEKIINAQNLNITEKYFVYGSNNQFDVLAKINNPNDQYGAGLVKYEFQLLDQNGAVLNQKEGETFILPRENRYIVELNLYSEANPYELKFNLIEVQWEEFLDYDEPKLNIYKKDYREENDNNIVFGLLRNESYFDFNSIEINIILRDAKGNPVALGKNEMRTIKSQEERDFKLVWPYKFAGDVQNVEVQAEANVFDSDNFIKKYLPNRQFQKYEETGRF